MPAATYKETLASSGAHFGEYAGARTPASFGDPAKEFASLRDHSSVYDLSWRGKLIVSGEDRIRWMNGMVTSNVRDLQPQHGNFAYVLNPQGRIQFDAILFNRGDYLLVTTEMSEIAGLKDYFDRYIIMDDVEVADVSEKLASIGISGPASATTLRSAGLLTRELEPGEVLDAAFQSIGYSVARSPVAVNDAYELWFAAENYSEFWNALTAAGATPVGSTALEWLRIAKGLPRIGHDIGDRELPQETAQDYALHFAKGCYIGQEIVERIHSRGNVNRVLSGLELHGPLPERGAKILLADKEVGEIRSTAEIPVAASKHSIALSFLRREAAAPGTELKVGETTAKVVALPFVF